jgi:hypothetical protein
VGGWVGGGGGGREGQDSCTSAYAKREGLSGADVGAPEKPRSGRSGKGRGLPGGPASGRREIKMRVGTSGGGSRTPDL